jgi:hypothetical protein
MNQPEPAKQATPIVPNTSVRYSMEGRALRKLGNNSGEEKSDPGRA